MGYGLLVIADVLSTERGDYPGRHRIEGLCKYWARSGCDVHILTPGPTVSRAVAGCTYHLTATDRRSVWVRFPSLGLWRNRILHRILIPDAGILWYPQAVRRAARLVRSSKIDLVFSSFASASSHVIASAVSRRHSLPWIADYRDIWTDNVYHDGQVPLYLFKGRQPRRLTWNIHSSLEARTVRRALLVSTLSAPMAEVLRQKLGDDIPVCLIPNGYDDDLLSTLPHTPSGQFVIGYTGKLNNSSGYTELGTLFQTLAELRAQDPALAEQIVFRYWGYQTDLVRRLSAERKIEKMVELHGPCSYEASVSHQRESTILLLMLPLDERVSRGVSSRKLFDYLAAKRPIIGIVPPGSDAGEIILRTQSGHVAPSQDAIKQVLCTYLCEFQNTGSVTYSGQEAVVREFAFSGLAAHMLSCFEDATQVRYSRPRRL